MGLPLDIRSDLYCLGLLLYETITGRSVRNQSASATSVLLQAASEEVELPDLDVSEPLRNAIARALSQRADDRLPTAEAMSSALQDTPRPRRRPIPRVGASSIQLSVQSARKRSHAEHRCSGGLHVARPGACSFGSDSCG